MNTKYLKSCKYNDSVDCLVFSECDKCGWNPANEELRKRRAEQALENRWKPKKSKPKSHTNNKRPVYCPELDRTFESLTEAEKELRLCRKSIHKVFSGEAKSVRGLTFVDAK